MMWGNVSMLRLFVLSLVFFLAAVSNSSSAEFNQLNARDCSLKITGKILKGDAEKFEGYLRANNISFGWENDTLLCFDSPGGYILDALEIGKFVYENHLPTRIRDDEECLSACAFIFLMGRQSIGEIVEISRILYKGGTLGVHRPSINLKEDGYSQEVVIKAFDVAVDSVLKMVELANKVGSLSGEKMIETDLLKGILSHRGQEFLYLETIDQLVLWNIDFKNHPQLDLSLNKFQAFNFCVNYTRSKFNLDPDHTYVPDIDFYKQSLEHFTTRLVSTNDSVTDVFFIDLPGEDNPGLPCVVYLEKSTFNNETYIGINHNQNCIDYRQSAVNTFPSKPSCLGRGLLFKDYSYLTFDGEFKINKQVAKLKSTSRNDAAGGKCKVISKSIIIDEEYCSKFDEVINQNGVELVNSYYFWPSGAKTVVSRRLNSYTINGVPSRLQENRHGVCFFNRETRNEFCYKKI